MAEHPIYLSDPSLVKSLGISRPCAVPVEEHGSCDEAAVSIGCSPGSSWVKPYSGTYGWVCAAHERVLTNQYQPERIAAMRRQLAAEGAAFWDNYGIEASETPRLTVQQQELDSLNSDI